MNIFVTSYCPAESARNLDDKRVIKMILETAQMLSFVVWQVSGYKGQSYVPGFYKAEGVSFAKHPCTIWAGKSFQNAMWLRQHGLVMCQVYEEVYGKKHKALPVIKKSLPHLMKLPYTGPTAFANCTEDKVSSKPIIHKYREFMDLKWSERDVRPPTWQKRQQPSWSKYGRF